MAKNSQQKSPIVTMAIVGLLGFALYYLHQGSAWVTNQVAALPVEGQRQQQQADTAAAPRQAPTTLHPLLVEASRKGATARPDGATVGAAFDVVFGKNDADDLAARTPVATAGEAKAASSSAPAAPPVDHFGELVRSMQLQAISSEGAIISGRFVGRGEALPHLAYPDAQTGAMLRPVLKATEERYVLIQEAKGKRVARLTLER